MNAKVTLNDFDGPESDVRQVKEYPNCLFGTADKDSGDLIIYRNLNEVVTRLAIYPRGNWYSVEAIET